MKMLSPKSKNKPQQTKITYSKFFGRSLAIYPGRLESILSNQLDVSLAAEFKGTGARTPYPVSNGIAVIDVQGPLISGQLGWLEMLFGMMSYDDIERDFVQALNDPAVKGILFNLDSPGGEAGGMFDLSDAVYNARGSKPIWAIANEEAYSAAYGIASAADKVFITRTGAVGSVGVIAVHMETSKKDELEGLAYTLIRGGKYKAEQNSLEPLTDHAQQSIQSEVDRIYGMFVEMIARNRGLSPETILKTEAGIFYGELAVNAGFADSIGNLKETLAEFQQSNQGKPTITAQDDSPVPGLTALSGEIPDAVIAAALSRERESVSKIIELCDLVHRPGWAGELIKAGITPEHARARILNRLADESDSIEIDSRLNLDRSATRDPIRTSGLNTAEIYNLRNKRR
jgi:capsid assembly protease